MKPTAFVSKTIIAMSLGLILSACDGNSGNPEPLEPGVTPQADAEVISSAPRKVTFADDIEPIMKNKCNGCHSDDTDRIAPFSLIGVDNVNAFRSAIYSSLENGTMPSFEAPQLTPDEKAKFMAWLNDELYTPVLNRVSLINQNAWDLQTRVRDSLSDHRPASVSCPAGNGWEVEDGELEVSSEFCNYLSLTQQSLLQLTAGQEVEVSLSHSELNFNAPSTAHVAVTIGGNTVFDKVVDIPSAQKLYKEKFALTADVAFGDEIVLHLHNHGDNAWTLHGIDTFIVGEPQTSDFCPSFDSTFEAIQATVFEAAGCANSLCHGEAQSGGLDLRPEVAYENLLDVPSTNSSHVRLKPKKPAESFLYQKLAEKTFPGSYAISGSPMPSAGNAISASQLEAIRWWIEAGAPKEGSIGDFIGRGENEIERLLGVCLPEPEAVGVQPLPPPAPDKGVQMRMPPHEILAEQERELCFAAYYDFRDQVPEQYLDESRDNIYIRGDETREDPFTHHLILMYPRVPTEDINAPQFGTWSCSPNSGELTGEVCDPLNLNACGPGMCRSKVVDSIACRGYGPSSAQGAGLANAGVGGGIDEPGYYVTIPSHGIYYWNSHAFNLTTQDAVHRVWRNFYFADDLRFKQNTILYTANIFQPNGIPPFTKRTVCNTYEFDQGDELLHLSSHTHKRGGYFSMDLLSTGERIYESYNYDEPVRKRFIPPLLFDSADPAERTIEYCAEYNNGLNPDGSFNVETVRRLSRIPARTACVPTACAEGRVGEPCSSADDDASCDSSPCAGDGSCDACPIRGGITTDDEMFIPIITKLIENEDAVNAP
ncbi:MAG: hypothetical protein ACR2P1_27140 [Pseudomonadales bacterium]